MSPPLVVTARGGRYEVGLAHGEQARDLVHGTLAWSLQQLSTGGVGHEEARTRASGLLPHIVRSVPELLEECHGIADGAGLPLIDVVIVNARYELLFLTGSSAPRPGVAGAECSLVGIAGHRSASGSPVIGQNVDLGADARSLWILLDAAPDDAPRVLTVTMAGMLAQEGLNSAGLALCGSMVRSSDWREGLPTRKFLRRKVLEQPTVARAIAVIAQAPQRASSHNLMLADDSTVVDVETTAGRVGVNAPKEGVICHTNHYLHAEFEGENAGLGAYLENSSARWRTLERGMGSRTGSLGVADVKAILADHSGGANAVCRHAERDAYRGETNVAVVLEPSSRAMHVAFGPPCVTPFHTYVLPADRTAPLEHRPAGDRHA